MEESHGFEKRGSIYTFEKIYIYNLPLCSPTSLSPKSMTRSNDLQLDGVGDDSRVGVGSIAFVSIIIIDNMSKDHMEKTTPLKKKITYHLVLRHHFPPNQLVE